MSVTGHPGVLLLIGSAADETSQGACERLEGLGSAWRSLAPEELASACVTLSSDGARLDGEPVAGVIFLGRPSAGLSDAFAESDQGFADHETRALWVALLSHPNVWTVNRADTDLWFTHSEWPIWRRRLQAAGVTVAPLTAGGEPGDEDAGWLPYTGGGVGPLPPAGVGPFLGAAYATEPEATVAFWCCGRRLGGEPTPTEAALAWTMAEHDCRYFAATLDSLGRVLRLTIFPEIDSPVLAAEAGRLLAEEAHAHCYRR